MKIYLLSVLWRNTSGVHETSSLPSMHFNETAGSNRENEGVHRFNTVKPNVITAPAPSRKNESQARPKLTQKRVPLQQIFRSQGKLQPTRAGPWIVLPKVDSQQPLVMQDLIADIVDIKNNPQGEKIVNNIKTTQNQQKAEEIFVSGAQTIKCDQEKNLVLRKPARWMLDWHNGPNDTRIEGWVNECDEADRLSKPLVIPTRTPESPAGRFDEFLQILDKELRDPHGVMDDQIAKWVENALLRRKLNWPKTMGIEKLLTAFEIYHLGSRELEFRRRLNTIFSVGCPGYVQVLKTEFEKTEKANRFGIYRKLIEFTAHLHRIHWLIPKFPTEFSLRSWRPQRVDEVAVAPKILVQIIPDHEAHSENQMDKENLERVLRQLNRDDEMRSLVQGTGKEIENTWTFEIIVGFQNHAGRTEWECQELAFALCTLETLLFWYPTAAVVAERSGPELMAQWFFKLLLREPVFATDFSEAFGLRKFLEETVEFRAQLEEHYFLEAGTNKRIRHFYRKYPELESLELRTVPDSFATTMEDFVAKFVNVKGTSVLIRPEQLRIESSNEESDFSHEEYDSNDEIHDHIYIDSTSSDAENSWSNPDRSVELSASVKPAEKDSFDTRSDSDEVPNEMTEIFDNMVKMQMKLLVKQKEISQLVSGVERGLNIDERQCESGENESFKVLTVGFQRKPVSKWLKNPMICFIVRTVHCEGLRCQFLRGNPTELTIFGAEELNFPTLMQGEETNAWFDDQSGRFMSSSSKKLTDPQVVHLSPSVLTLPAVSQLVNKFLPKIVELDETVDWEENILWRLRRDHPQTRFTLRPVFVGASTGTKRFAECIQKAGVQHDITVSSALSASVVGSIDRSELALNKAQRGTILGHLAEVVGLDKPLLGRREEKKYDEYGSWSAV